MRIRNTVQDLIPFVFTKENEKYIASGLLLTGIEIGLNLLTPFILSQTIASLTTNSSDKFLGIEVSPLNMTALYGISWTLAQLVMIGRNSTVVPVGQHASRKLHEHYLQYLMNQSLQYHRSTHEADHDFRLSKCYASMPEVCTQFFSHILPTTAEIIIANVILCRYYGLKIGFGLLGMLLVYTGYSMTTIPQVRKLRLEYLTSGYDNYYAMKEAIRDFETVQLFNNTPHTVKKINEKLRQAANRQIRSDTIIIKINFIQMLIAGMGFLCLCLLVGNGVLQKRHTIKDFIVVSSYLAQFVTPLAAFGASINQILSACTELESFFEEMKQKPDIIDQYPLVKLLVDRSNAKIEFRNVCFSYPDNALCIDNLSFTVLPGQTLGIVGESGSGKSTIANLLYRFSDPTSGAVLINGQDIKTVGLLSLRSVISIVPQAPALFNDTIYNNIIFGGLSRKEGVTKEEVESAIETACLRQYITTLPAGFDTIVGEHGAKISGGQKQRVAIARALLKNPCIFIFDEATSALDAKTEKEIQKNIDNISDDVTTTAIIITHHLTNVLHANHIIVLNKGKIIEQGTHQELLERGGKYAQLWQIQNAHHFEDENAETAELPETQTPSVGKPHSLLFRSTLPAHSGAVSVDIDNNNKP